MTDRFVDTSGWASWAVKRDVFHPLAVGVFGDTLQANRRLVTTNWVLAELTGSFISPYRLSKPTQVRVLDGIRGDRSVTVIAIDARLEMDAWHLWRTRLDKDWSLVDCASFVVMTRLGLAEAITAGHHFGQAGFVRLLK